MIARRAFKAGAVIATALVVAGCAEPAEIYARYEERLVQKGFFRTDVAPDDAPFDRDDLRRNFIEVALYSEFSPDGVDPERTERPLGRWAGPVNYTILGEEVSDQDRRDIVDLMLRLSELTGLEVNSTTPEAIRTFANFQILFLNEEERRIIVDTSTTNDGFGGQEFRREWATNLNRPCIGQIRYDSDRNITHARVYIKSETSGIFRKSCIHEEIVQSFGLLNDADWIRPSLFNDTNEFALMTLHDEYLMRILYDDRLSSGMKEPEVTPLLDDIVRSLDLEGSS